MGVVATESTAVANHIAVPAVKSDVSINGGRKRFATAKVAIAADDDDTSVYYLLPVHSSWVITSIRLFNDAITGGTDFNVGLYNADLTDKDENAYADAISLASASTDGTELAFEIRDITALGQRVYQDAGETEDPGVWYLLALTGVTVGSGAGDVVVDLTYTID